LAIEEQEQRDGIKKEKTEELETEKL